MAPWFCAKRVSWFADPLALFSKAGNSWPALPCRMFLANGEDGGWGGEVEDRFQKKWVDTEGRRGA